MSRLERMIQTLCPDGVSFANLGDFASINKGQQLNLTEMTDDAPFPVLNGGINPSGYYDQYNTEENTIAISQGGASAGYVNFMETKFWAGAHCYVVEPKKSILDNKFLYYFIKNIETEIQRAKYGAGIPGLNKSTLQRLSLPIPPLPVQEEIVRILDTFSGVVAELEQNLEAEQAARVRQYEHYRNALFEENQRSEKKTLGDVGKVCMCRRIYKEQTDSSGDVPFYKIGTFGKEPDAFISKELFEEYKSKYSYPKKGDILFSAAGTIGRTVIFDGAPSYFQDSNIVWIDNDETLVLNKYLYYFYSLGNWATSEGGTIARLYNDNISRTPISVPPLEVQDQIASILDRFDALVNDLKSGLPAEIALRRKQYEYYRDKLLTFQPLK